MLLLLVFHNVILLLPEYFHQKFVYHEKYIIAEFLAEM